MRPGVRGVGSHRLGSPPSSASSTGCRSTSRTASISDGNGLTRPFPKGLGFVAARVMTEVLDFVMDVSVSQLRAAIESQHGGIATFDHTVPVKEEFLGRAVWEGIVHVFKLSGHARATIAYAWSSLIEGGDKRRFYAVLRVGSIRSPVDAVRAAIIAEHRQSGAKRRGR